MLYSQLQEGLWLSIIKSPSISGALVYRELCMAVKHEEKRQVELRKCQESERITGAKDNRPRDHRHKQDRRNNNRGDIPVSDNKPPSQVGTKNSGNESVISVIKPDTWQGTADVGDKSEKQQEADTRQVSTENSGTLSSVPPAERSKMSHSNLPPMGNADPLSYLCSSDLEGQVDTIQVNDEGSRLQYVNVAIRTGGANFKNHRHRS